jgi:hypothetical protein
MFLRMHSIGPPGSQPVPEQPQQGGGDDASRSFSVVWLLAAIGLLVVGWVVLRDGSSDREEDAVEAVVIEAATSTDPGICDRLFTAGWLGTHFEADLPQTSVERCREVTGTSEDWKAISAEVTNVLIDDRGALVTAELTGGNVGRARMSFSLVRDPGWKLDRLTAVDVDVDPFLQAQRKVAAHEDVPSDAAPLIECMFDWAERNATSDEISTAILNGNSYFYSRSFAECHEEFRQMAFSPQIISAGTSYTPAQVECMSRVINKTIQDDELRRLFISYMSDAEPGAAVDAKRNAAIALCARTGEAGQLG